MDALKRSLASEKQAAPAAAKAKGKKPKKAAAGQREMLLPISGGGKRAGQGGGQGSAEEGRGSRCARRPHQEGRMIGQGARIASS
jgi:DNA end-binding protein Ku